MLTEANLKQPLAEDFNKNSDAYTLRLPFRFFMVAKFDQHLKRRGQAW